MNEQTPVAPPAAPAAPVAPAPNAPLIPPTAPPAGPQLSATEKATQAARALMAQGKSLGQITGTAPAAPAQPRASDGTFTQKPAEGSAPLSHDNPPPPEPVAAGEDGTQPAGDDASGRAEDIDPNAAPAGGAGEAPDPELVVALPPRRAGETPLEITVSDKETADALRRLANGYGRRDEVEAVRAEAQQVYQEIAAEREEIAIDPAGYLVSAVPPEIQADVALFLLTQPHIWESIRDDVLALEDDVQYRTTAAEVKARRLELRDQLRQAASDRAVIQRNATEVKQAVASLVPQDMPDEVAESFYRDALRDLKEHAERNGLRTLNPDDVPVLLARRMRQVGIDPLAVATRAAAPAASLPAGTPAPRAAASQVPSQRTGAQFKQASATRRAAAATPAAGAGAPAAAPMAPPPNQSIAERQAWARQHLKLAPR